MSCKILAFYVIQKQSPRGVPQKSVLKNFAKFIGKHRCQRLFLNKIAGLLIKNETLIQVFSCEYCETFKKNLFHRTPPVALLVIMVSFLR